MKSFRSQLGFTLIETLVAILVLSLSITALLSLAASGFFTVRYSRNQIIADALTQESLEYIRNSRDSSLQRGETWGDWIAKLNVNTSGGQTGATNRGCFSSQGCIIDPYTVDEPIRECGSTCPYIVFYEQHKLYGYGSPATYPFSLSVPAVGYQTTYRRTVNARLGTDPNQIIFNVRMEWKNGNTLRSATQSIVIANWSL